MSFPIRATTLVIIGALLLAPLTYSRPVLASSPEQTASAGALSSSRLRAIASASGVVIQWAPLLETPSLGFNLFRISKGHATQLNPSLIAGSVLIVHGHSQTYSWFDSGGTIDCEYYVESVDLRGNSVFSEATSPVWQAALPTFQQAELLSNLGAGGRTPDSTAVWPADQAKSRSEIAADSSSPESLNDQWTIANQLALKIGVRSDGWYRITQAQLVAAGFDTTGDARNLQLFVTGAEVAIHVSRESGALTSADYLEFWGQGLDTPSSDTQIYWLINGVGPGRRMAVKGELGLAAPPIETLTAPKTTDTRNGGSWYSGLPYIAEKTVTVIQPDRAKSPERNDNQTAPADRLTIFTPSIEPPTPSANKSVVEKPAAEPLSPAPITEPDSKAPSAKATVDRSPKLSRPVRRSRQPSTVRSSRKYRRHRSKSMRHRNHAVVTSSATPAFTYSVQHNERNIYYPAALNGARENFFGPIVGSNGTSVTIPLHRIDQTSSAQAQVQVAIQGVNFVNHQVRVLVNGSAAGLISFVDETSTNQTFPIPASWLIDGDNEIKLAPVHPDLCATAPNDPRCSDLSVAEYVRVTYPHTFSAENDSLQFSVKSNQSAKIDGFSTSNIRMLDVTDPAAIQEVRPILETSGLGFSATVPESGKGKARRIVVLPQSRLSQPVSLTLNQPSTLNGSNNAGGLVIIAFKDFMPALAPLVEQRRTQGYVVKLVNVEDVFDEFSYGVHDPQAIRDFMLRAKTAWSQPPDYLMLVGDATYDPRNYMGSGNVDFVPTKQIDTGTISTVTALETASDDWFTDFNDDGIGDISVGRLPAGTVAEANLMVSKIVNYSPANTGNKALLVADTQGSYYFNFEAANDQVASTLPAGMTIQKVYRRLQASDAVANANIIANLNSGQSVTVYSGHGNVNIWGGSIFTSTDAAALTNGNRLSFIVVMDCLNGYFDDPQTKSLGESVLSAPNGGAVASFASSGLTIPDGQHQMGFKMFQLLYGGTPIAIGDASRLAKSATTDMDVRRTWILLGDPTLRIR